MDFCFSHKLAGFGKYQVLILLLIICTEIPCGMITWPTSCWIMIQMNVMIKVPGSQLSCVNVPHGMWNPGLVFFNKKAVTWELCYHLIWLHETAEWSTFRHWPHMPPSISEQSFSCIIHACPEDAAFLLKYAITPSLLSLLVSHDHQLKTGS